MVRWKSSTVSALGSSSCPKRPNEWRVDSHGCYKFDNAALGFGPRDQSAHLPVFLHLRTTNLPAPPASCAASMHNKEEWTAGITNMTVHERDVHDCDPVRPGHVSAFPLTPSAVARESFASQLCLPTALTHGRCASFLCLSPLFLSPLSLLSLSSSLSLFSLFPLSLLSLSLFSSFFLFLFFLSVCVFLFLLPLSFFCLVVFSLLFSLLSLSLLLVFSLCYLVFSFFSFFFMFFSFLLCFLFFFFFFLFPFFSLSLSSLFFSLSLSSLPRL